MEKMGGREEEEMRTLEGSSFNYPCEIITKVSKKNARLLTLPLITF